jgi:hypothetical protein
MKINVYSTKKVSSFHIVVDKNYEKKKEKITKVKKKCHFCSKCNTKKTVM